MFSVQRKVHNIRGSLLVVLPKIWIQANGLQADDVVEIQLNDNLTILAPKKQEAGKHA